MTLDGLLRHALNVSDRLVVAIDYCGSVYFVAAQCASNSPNQVQAGCISPASKHNMGTLFMRSIKR